MRTRVGWGVEDFCRWVGALNFVLLSLQCPGFELSGRDLLGTQGSTCVHSRGVSYCTYIRASEYRMYVRKLRNENGGSMEDRIVPSISFRVIGNPFNG